MNSKTWSKNKNVNLIDYVNMAILFNSELPIAIDEQNVKIRNDGTVGALSTDGSSPKKNNRIMEVDKMNKIRIRKLTPTECYKLMGFTEDDCKKASDVGISNAQLYKQAGNSIVVNVLEAIFKSLGKIYDDFKGVVE